MAGFHFGLARRARGIWQDWRGMRDARQLAALGLDQDSCRRQMDLAALRLRPAYDLYIQSVSTAEMAVSWESACFLYAVAALRQPQRLLDLGSGFSSYVLRAYAAQAQHPAEVTSVDDNRHWLTQTAQFLTSQGLPADRLWAWDEFRQQPTRPGFDLVFHDLGTMSTRAAALPHVLQCVSAAGALILDDMHKVEYHATAHQTVPQDGWTLLSARRHTLDGLGRFSEVALRRCA